MAIPTKWGLNAVTKREVICYVVVIILLLVTILGSLMVGTTFFSLERLLTAFLSHNQTDLALLVQIRLPRVLASLICGGMLSVAGAISQATFHNYLADPSILGVTSAGSFLTLLAGFVIPDFPLDKLIYAFLGGGLTLVFLSSRTLLKNSYKLIIVGVALNLTLSGFQQLFSGNLLVGINSFNGITWPDTLTLLIMGVIGLAFAIIFSPWANYLKMPDSQLALRGVTASKLRLVLLVIVVYLASGATAEVGVVPFVGIIVPNVVRYLVGHDYQTIVPLSMLLGSWLLLMTDTIGRIIVLPGEIPVATIMTVLGGPFLIWMLWRQKFNEIR